MSNVSSILHSGYHIPLTREWQSVRPLTKSALMYPIFISDKDDAKDVISSMPNQYRWGVNRLEELLDPLVKKGLRSVILFGVLEDSSKKDFRGSLADSPDGPVVRAIKLIRNRFPDLAVACDICLCEYTDHGHCGLLFKDGTINNTESVARIAEVSVNYALAGAQILAPSDCMDGRILAIKEGLIQNQLSHRVMLLSYAAKFASCFYGPFRDAADSAPAFGDRSCYQLPPASRGLARRAIQRDLREGADAIMVKPGTAFMDIIADAANLAPDVPIATYHVSGEFAMLHAAAKAGVFDLKRVVLEVMNGFMRAGCSIILTYFTPELLDWLSE
ncbi:porphobilinogen synthase Hem2 [Schizosaccharomyces japonicus yFS275]|uniref:Delta-aminolevulinic acid dehydratase n=1 Tax=Schizosaccharomyces japonicus (strain yFS275 / FY16936) TaxID=402676 RepID=B6JXR1_SCHJY|nr:porphobilinogen synthase Hem2 [Schizosaccharomyces japonicus yFS275]EEB06329.1 porphobilinogen synthase Hem2 [Schizosaccharomyces japonicus yFS275]